MVFQCLNLVAEMERLLEDRRGNEEKHKKIVKNFVTSDQKIINQRILELRAGLLGDHFF